MRWRRRIGGCYLAILTRDVSLGGLKALYAAYDQEIRLREGKSWKALRANEMESLIFS